jgi:hypothetical protein
VADTYLAISQIANSESMRERMRAAITQQSRLGNAPMVQNPLQWVDNNRYVWAAAPGWGEAWKYALDSGNENPGGDEAVITDGMILATIQELVAPNMMFQRP